MTFVLIYDDRCSPIVRQDINTVSSDDEAYDVGQYTDNTLRLWRKNI